MYDIYDDKIYQDVLEAQLIKQACKRIETLFQQELLRLYNNQFLLRADELGIAAAESMFEITANPAEEDLEFRRRRLINRNTAKPPYTYLYLIGKLDELFGAENYTIHRDLANRTLYIASGIESAGWYQEVSFILNKIKPANLVYINNPQVSAMLQATEMVSVTERQYNYRLGISWALGTLPFVHYVGGSVLKQENIQSIQQKYFHELAQSGADLVDQVLLNGQKIIADFTLKAAETGQGLWIVEYEVSPSDVQEINKVDLLDAAGNVLTSSVVYVPVTDTVRVSHKFRIREG